MALPFAILSFVSAVAALSASIGADPQLHLTFSNLQSELIVTWHTVNLPMAAPAIQHASTPSSPWSALIPAFSTTSFANDQCPANSTRYSASARLPLAPGESAMYRVTSDGGATFSSPATATNPLRAYPQRVALWGDLGVACGGVLPPSPGFAGGPCSAAGQLAADAAAGAHDWSLHYGDSGYNMDDSCGVVGDTFMARTAPYTARLPHVVSPRRSCVFRLPATFSRQPPFFPGSIRTETMKAVVP